MTKVATNMIKKGWSLRITLGILIFSLGLGAYWFIATKHISDKKSETSSLINAISPAQINYSLLQNLESCKNLSEYGKKVGCWEKIVTEVMKTSGMDATWDIVATISAIEPLFAQNCHGFTHIIGEEAYQLFKKENKVNFNPKASYCGYGFYHGFMETLAQVSGNFEEARTLCKSFQNAWRSCYHGIGHGTVDGSDPQTWGDAYLMIAPGLQLCERLGRNFQETNLCASGVFNSLAILYTNPKYKLVLKEDPYWICKDQSKLYFKKPCFEEMNTWALRLGNYDFSKAKLFVEKINDDIYAGHAMRSLATYAAKFALERKNSNDFILSCRATKQHLQHHCIDGFVGGLFEFGMPGKEYHIALEFCNQSRLSHQEKMVCYTSFNWFSSLHYSEKQQKSPCALIEKEYRHLCT